MAGAGSLVPSMYRYGDRLRTCFGGIIWALILVGSGEEVLEELLGMVHDSECKSTQHNLYWIDADGIAETLFMPVTGIGCHLRNLLKSIADSPQQVPLNHPKSI